MLKSSLLFFVFILSGFSVFAKTTSDFQTTEDILAVVHTEKPTNCASAVFSQALTDHSNEISETDDEARVRAWAREAMQSPDVLEQILQCPEMQNIADDTTVVFTPIVYEFKRGNTVVRTITVNYSTQPKVLKQKILLSQKRSLPNGDANPNLMDPDDPAKYLNTEPAWYAIMVVQHDALKDFVGPNKNNTLSMKYLNDHIDEIYPRGYFCTSKSAIANDDYTINQVVKQVVDVDDDSNDYYVAGDVNLEWVMYAEVAADILIFAATAGTGEVAMAAAKGARASRTSIQLAKNSGKLKSLPHVAEYAKSANKITQFARNAERMEKNLKNAKKYEQVLKKLDAAKRANKTSDIAKYQKEANEIMETARKIDPGITDDLLKKPTKMETELKNINKKIPDMEKELAEWKKTKSADEIKDIDKYTENTKQLENMLDYRNSLSAYKSPQKGNFIAKSLNVIKSIRAANSGAKTMTKAGRVARAGMSSRSAKTKDFLLDATLKHGARLARVERDVGLVYGAIEFLGEMYDKTSTTSKEFSNGIEFKPLCLLSADDLKGQENVVNYGMWLMWQGDSTNAADDDAAYLQAMDFAAKFFYKLDEYQDEYGANCNIDIYVVRPIIRLDETNIDNPSGELFYLFMNEIPWSTADQFISTQQQKLKHTIF